MGTMMKPDKDVVDTGEEGGKIGKTKQGVQLRREGNRKQWGGSKDVVRDGEGGRGDKGENGQGEGGRGG